MTMVVADDSRLQVDSQPKSDGLVWGSAAAWRCSTFTKRTEWTFAMTLWSWWQHCKYRLGQLLVLLLLLLLLTTSFISSCCICKLFALMTLLLHGLPYRWAMLPVAAIRLSFRVSVPFGPISANRKVTQYVHTRWAYSPSHVLGSGYKYDPTSMRPSFDSHSTAVQPRYEHSKTYITTVWRYRNSIIIIIIIIIQFTCSFFPGVVVEWSLSTVCWLFINQPACELLHLGPR